MSVAPPSTIPHPDLMSWPEWAANFVGYNQLAADISVDMSWPDFSDRLSLIYQNVPRPEAFRRWQDWVEQLRINLLS